MDNPELQIGMKFSNFAQFKAVCRNWSIKQKFQIVFAKVDSKRCIVEYYNKREQKCDFRLYVAPVSKVDPII